jgi:hypothetical protein
MLEKLQARPIDLSEDQLEVGALSQDVVDDVAYRVVE